MAMLPFGRGPVLKLSKSFQAYNTVRFVITSRVKTDFNELNVFAI